MAAVGISSPANVSPASFQQNVRSETTLLQSLQLVEKGPDGPVPHHLLETQIFSKLAQNSVVQACPAAIHFSGFEPGKTHKQVLRLVNASTEVQRMHIIPPQSSYFKISYAKGERLVPGLALLCTIEFIPDEWRYFYDCIRIHCKDDDNIVVPIHAYPVMNSNDFPEQVIFPMVPVGRKKSRLLPLRCHAPIDFEFQIQIIQAHSAFTIEPLEGVVPAHGQIDICITFSPQEFHTATSKIQLIISQFNSKPLTCYIVGTSQPGLAKKLSEKTYHTEAINDSVLDPRAITPLDRARKKRLVKTKAARETSRQQTEIERDGIKFPADLDTPYAVAQVLNQPPGRLRMKDLRKVLSSQRAQSGSTRQVKAAAFEQAVRKNIYDERQNQLRWQLKLGDAPMEPAQKIEIIEARREAWTHYKLVRGDPQLDEEYRRTRNLYLSRRTRRDASDVAPTQALFDPYMNDPWAARHMALNRFRQAARRVIVRLRADKKITELRQTLLNPNIKRTISTPLFGGGDKEKEEETETAEDLMEKLVLEADKITTVTFPSYNPPNIKDDMPYDYCITNFPDPEHNLLAVDALGEVPYKPTEIILKEKISYFNLKVPQQYRLWGYEPHDVHEAASSYVPAQLARPLRTGAEEEVITIATGEPEEDACPPTATITQKLQPPPALFKPVKYPPLHIFNPAPGLQVFQQPMPYAETDPDYHLCPLPRYNSSGRPRLDKNDVVRGMMHWKRFPSQGLTSLANTPTLTSVWVPRWDDPFDPELLPTEVPGLFDGLPQEDLEDIEPEDEAEAGAAVGLTPEMVNTQFPLIDESAAQGDDKALTKNDFPFGNKMPTTNIPVSHIGPVPRETRERELEYFMKKKYNNLGAKIYKKVKSYDKLKTNPDLVLK